jgi:beta-lactamase class A
MRTLLALIPAVALLLTGTMQQRALGVSQRPPPLANPVEQAAREGEMYGAARWVAVFAREAGGRGRVLADYRGSGGYPAASVIKLPVMLAVYQAWESDTSRKRIPEGERLMKRMITQSDNAAANALLDFLGAPTGDPRNDTPGMERVNAVIRALLGTDRPSTVIHTKLGPPFQEPPPNRASPKEVSELLAALARREWGKDAAAKEMLTLMRGTSPRHRTRIPKPIPARFRSRVANKTGTLLTVVNDAAVVETTDGRRYVLCIFMEGVKGIPRAEQLAGRISAACWNRFAGPGFTPVRKAAERAR